MMLTAHQNGTEIQGDGRTVWVNGPDGCNIGRFSQLGYDVHHGVKIQVRTGAVCQDCKEGPLSGPDWESWCESMQSLAGVAVPLRFKPKWCPR